MNSYITGWRTSSPAKEMEEEESKWKDIEWIAWELAEGPPGIVLSKVTEVTSDTSSWKM
jgi:hypothetical protein